MSDQCVLGAKLRPLREQVLHFQHFCKGSFTLSLFSVSVLLIVIVWTGIAIHFPPTFSLLHEIGFATIIIFTLVSKN